MMNRLPSKGPRSPWSAGTRTLLARTCRECGELADGDSFPILNAGKVNQSRRRTCHGCTNALKKKNRVERGIGLPTPRPPERFQTSKYQRWSTEEDTYLRKNVGAMSYEEIAVALGRSLHSVYTRRGILGLAQVRKKHRVEKPWSIQA